MKNNQYFILICALFLFSVSKAQQEILYTQYVFSQFALNPAYAGNNDGFSLTALSRKQWFGLQGSPTSFSFLGQLLLDNKKSESRIFSGGSDKRNLVPVNNNQVGLGISIFNDRVGVSNTYIASFAYSYKIQFSPGKRLSLGLQTSILNNSQEFNRLDNPNISDPVFTDNVQTSKFNFGAGIFYESDRYYVGASVPEVLENYLNPNSKGDKTLRQYFFTGGYVFHLSQFYKFKPTIMVRYTEGIPMQFDINANLLYCDKIWVGCSYRYMNSVNIIFELVFSGKFRMGLSYDYPINEINKIAHQSAEIMISYRIQKSKKRVSSPRYF